MEKTLSFDICNLIRKEKNNLVTPKKTNKKIFSERKKLISFFPGISWKYASLAVVIVLLISFFISVFLIQSNEKKELRGNYATSIKLIEPLDGKYSKSLMKFRWVEIKGSEFYIVELFDDALRPIWTSNKIHTNSTILPKRIVDGLAENKKYFWLVTAYLSDGEKIESRIEHFTLTK
jgi:hypothetical protein